MEVLTSPLIVPIGAFVVAIVAVITGVMGQAHARRIKAEQRMAMVARGMSASEIETLLGNSDEDTKPSRDPMKSLGNARRAGIILVSTGAGIMIFFLLLTVIVQRHQVLAGAAAGFIPLCIGIGFFVDYHLQKRELSRFGLEVGADRAS